MNRARCCFPVRLWTFARVSRDSPRSSDDASRIAAEDPFTEAGDCTFELFDWDVRQILGPGPFSVVELDALNKAWREA